MDFSERLELYLQGGMIQQKDVDDVNAVVDMFKYRYGVVLDEENAGTFIAHLCAAYGRNESKEEVEVLPPEISEELMGLDTYPLSLEILDNILQVTQNPLNETERGYALLHINNLIANLHGNFNSKSYENI